MAEIPQHDLPNAALDGDRVLVLDGALNFRDLGGYCGADGRIVRRGMVFRSDHLAGLSDRDLDAVTALGLRAVHDFRLAIERNTYPSRLPDRPAPQVVLYNMGDVPDLGTSMVEMVQDMLHGRTPMAPASFWEDNYVTMLTLTQPGFVSLLGALAEAERLPALFHCAGGKDRTGLAATLLLAVLGVSEEQIVDDFLLTNRLRTLQRLEYWGPILQANDIEVASALPILGVTRASWQRAWAHLHETYGSPTGYLLDGGLDPEVPGRLQALLLE